MKGARGRPLCLLAVVWLWLSGAPAEAAALRGQLPGGLTILVRENSAAPVVAVTVLVRAGARWEREDNAGITNLLQQVMVKGTATRSSLEIAETAEDMGGSVGGSGGTDFSEIQGRGLARHWRKLLELIADVTLRPALRPDEIEGERRVILSAIRNRADQPFQRAFDALGERLYGAHPYALPPLGRAPSVSRLGRQELLDHYRRIYRAGRTIVSVSGHVSAPAVAAEVARLFAPMPPGEGDVMERPPAPAPAGERLVVNHPAAQAQVLAAFLAPSIGHPDYPAAKVLSTALGGGMSSRLFAELRDKQGLAYSTGAVYPSRVDPSFLLAYMATAPGNADRAEEGMRGVIERLARDGVGPDELARAKAYLLGQFALDRRTNARLAWYQAFFEATGVGHDFAERYIRAVEGVTAADLERVARTYLGSPTVVLLRPPAG